MFAKIFYQNVSMWGLVLKSLLQGTRWCNRISIMILGLEAMTFSASKSMGYVMMSVNLDFIVWLLSGLLSGPKIQLNWTQFGE